MKNRFYYRSEMHPWGKKGALFLLVAIPVALLVLYQLDMLTLDKPAEDSPYVTVTLSESNADSQKAASGDLQLSENFVPLDADLRQRMLQKFADYRAKYKQLQPRAAVVDTTEGQEADKFSHQLSSALALHQIQDSGLPEPKASENLPAPLILWHRPREATLARDFLATIAPAVAGEVLLVKDERLQSAAMILVVNARPLFSDKGVAYF